MHTGQFTDSAFSALVRPSDCPLAPLTSFKFVLSPRCALDGAWREFNMEVKLTSCGARILH